MVIFYTSVVLYLTIANVCFTVGLYKSFYDVGFNEGRHIGQLEGLGLIKIKNSIILETNPLMHLSVDQKLILLYAHLYKAEHFSMIAPLLLN